MSENQIHEGKRLYPRLVVLKFGGSVLQSERDIQTAVIEVKSWVRRGWKVVAVVSALEGTTDALIARADAYGAGTDEASRALLLATGEFTSGSLLGLALSGQGVRATVASPWSIGLRSEGTALDSTLTGISPLAVQEYLREHECLVVPGFVGIDAHGRLSLLGRGGSDLSALFIADRLGAHAARLIKDVDGLYEFDPALAREGVRPPPRRYGAISWDDALALGGGIVQPKAIRFAKERGLSFEVGEFLGGLPTVVGPGPSRLEPAARAREVPSASA